MQGIRIPSEAEVAELVSKTGDIARGLAFERDQLRELVKAKDQYIGCYKTGKRPSEKLFTTLERLTQLLFPS
jgi:hypothetical protein